MGGGCRVGRITFALPSLLLLLLLLLLVQPFNS